MRMLMWRGRPRPRNLVIGRVFVLVKLPVVVLVMMMMIMMMMIMMMMIMMMMIMMMSPVIVVSERSREIPLHLLLLLRPILLPGQVFFAVHPHIDLGGRNAAADDSGDFQPRAYAQRRYRLLQHARRHSGVDERAQEHVTAHAGKTF